MPSLMCKGRGIWYTGVRAICLGGPAQCSGVQGSGARRGPGAMAGTGSRGAEHPARGCPRGGPAGSKQGGTAWGGGGGREAELGLDGLAAALGERDLVLGGAAAEARQRPRDDGDLAEGLVDGEADDDHGDPEGEVRLREDSGRRRQGGPEDDEDEGGGPADALDPVQRGHELLL